MPPHRQVAVHRIRPLRKTDRRRRHTHIPRAGRPIPTATTIPILTAMVTATLTVTITPMVTVHAGPGSSTD